jgi:hypothetical protein
MQININNEFHSAKKMLRIRVSDNLVLELYEPNSLIAHKTYPLFVTEKSNEYCFNQDVSQYHHYIIIGNQDNIIEQELYYL